MSQAPPAAPPRERRIKPPGITTTSIAIFLSGCGLVMVIGGILMWFNNAYPDCGNGGERTVMSPDGKTKAVVFRRVCGASEIISTHVSILGSGEKLPNQAGNIFSASGTAEIAVRWLDDTRVVVDEPANMEVLLRVTKFRGIQIDER